MNAGPVLTIFTAPKPFTDGHITVIQRNAIRSWLALGPAVQVVLVGEEDGLAEAAVQLGVRHLPQVKRNPQGTPLVSSIFDLGRQANASPLLAYVNADILLAPDFVEAACSVQDQASRFLLVGQRWDLQVEEELDFSPGWVERLNRRIQQHGRLHPPGGSDYFIYPRECFTRLPPFAVGRAGWDNWMIYEARRQGWLVVDATRRIPVVHQDHDYRHLPGGQPHYRLPETGENVRLAGGRRTIFALRAANRSLDGAGKLDRLPFSWGRFWREVEIAPLVTLHSMALGQVFFALFHPRKAYHELRAGLSKLVRGIR
jgi:hypothetical protein